MTEDESPPVVIRRKSFRQPVAREVLNSLRPQLIMDVVESQQAPQCPEREESGSPPAD